VVVCLHGRNADHRFAFDTIGLHRFVAADRLPWAVVAVDGGDASYWHARADGTDAEAMVLDELLPAVHDEIGAAKVLLLGWSMGGYGALLAAADHADSVAAIAASSPAMWPSFAQAAPGAFVDEAVFRAHDVFDRVGALGRLPVRIDCGDEDPFIGTDRALAARLPRSEHVYGSGYHEAGTWRSRVPGQLAFFRRAVAG
jgi:pimeloyl-ACP methyl ester carboxylesterase